MKVQTIKDQSTSLSSLNVGQTFRLKNYRNAAHDPDALFLIVYCPSGYLHESHNLNSKWPVVNLTDNKMAMMNRNKEVIVVNAYVQETRQ